MNPVLPRLADGDLMIAGQPASEGISTDWRHRLPYPLREVLRRWRALIGMVVGVGIALGIGMTLLAASQASVDMYTADFHRSAADLYAVQQGGTLIPILPSDTPGTITQARNVLAQVRAMPEVTSALAVMTWPMERTRDGVRRTDVPPEIITTLGVDGDPTTISGALLLNQGRWLRRADEVVVGAKLSREKSIRVGDTLRLNGRDFSVVGVGRLAGFGFGLDSDAYMDSAAFRRQAQVGDVISILAIDSRDPATTRLRLDALNKLAVFDPPQLERLAADATSSQVAVNWVMIALTLAVAALFVATTLNHSVDERRLEFATLRAIGLPTRTILLTVAAEATAICVLASGFGVLLSGLLGLILNGYLAESLGLESLYSPDAGLFGIIFVLALGVGAGAGLLPARKATRVDPVDVLREA